jgi:hypothetical protein
VSPYFHLSTKEALKSLGVTLHIRSQLPLLRSWHNNLPVFIGGIICVYKVPSKYTRKFLLGLYEGKEKARNSYHIIVQFRCNLKRAKRKEEKQKKKGKRNGVSFPAFFFLFFSL